jgi:hypothetical protein
VRIEGVRAGIDLSGVREAVVVVVVITGITFKVAVEIILIGIGVIWAVVVAVRHAVAVYVGNADFRLSFVRVSFLRFFRLFRFLRFFCVRLLYLFSFPLFPLPLFRFSCLAFRLARRGGDHPCFFLISTAGNSES